LFDKYDSWAAGGGVARRGTEIVSGCMSIKTDYCASVCLKYLILESAIAAFQAGHRNNFKIQVE
jgi:hypothetical protein